MKRTLLESILAQMYGDPKPAELAVDTVIREAPGTTDGHDIRKYRISVSVKQSYSISPQVEAEEWNAAEEDIDRFRLRMMDRFASALDADIQRALGGEQPIGPAVSITRELQAIDWLIEVHLGSSTFYGIAERLKMEAISTRPKYSRSGKLKRPPTEKTVRVRVKDVAELLGFPTLNYGDLVAERRAARTK